MAIEGSNGELVREPTTHCLRTGLVSPRHEYSTTFRNDYVSMLIADNTSPLYHKDIEMCGMWKMKSQILGVEPFDLF